ncbi:glycerol-3-phosphate dehydrogenase [Burkholderia thailandensis]|uniref:Glycerol-3-phosphate dehydrogenase n=1 Tax=Burkholderia thailandensis (strain ATCC 700388 / DSM 13276 / CCUG 48851 / CIP 106301 / E264) TaxID=271848 RepID=Q2T0Z2_BURTA|nr:glycerol-3-phosphate dehydrogenase [Burkholderia thailandensis]ABC38027.1 glycerol-3-phosphate dehydrogenase [Burkholderia thailandensis E264]AHI73666.1 FAD dependent oxidoreductase family protein [Burkholderia thailandensis 2002721723]AHI77772.1 FAD dependent oxidoreductase family protein [Burkholderia thailandensis E444]AIC85715.1 FAD dependent oxidoreductase family protein [Burkholderia thailandensis USAMRU Malaysia \
MTQQNRYDLLVVGGGINGAGIARDAAGRGLSVLLCEQDDLASHTSSSSTKLIHGGLRYLEYKEFGLVRKALQERETLLRAAPHIIWPLRFVMPHMPNLRPAWLIRIGLFLYDHLAKRELLPGSRGIDMRRHPAGAPLVDSIKRGFVYSDGWVDDARLVVLNALDAQERGARILTRTKLVSAERRDGQWHARLQRADGSTLDVCARAVANAAGPWVGDVLHGALGRGAQHSVRLVKGSHIVTRRLFDHDHAYIFQNPDKRIIFAIPYERDFTLIGTTDVEYRDDPSRVAIDRDETRYLCESINRYFKRKISPADVCWTYSGVRPLLEDENADNPSAVTRDYRLELDGGDGAPLLSVFGGKITTFRKLAEEATDMLGGALGASRGAWTAGVPLPGGDIADARFAPFAEAFAKRHPWLPAALARRYARAYGTRAERVIGGAKSLAELGAELAPGLYEAELRYLRDAEWASCADDVLWRRSKLGLHVAPGTLDAVTAALDAWFGAAREAASAAH